MRELANNDQIIDKTPDEILALLRSRSTDELLATMNAGVLGKRLNNEQLKKRLIDDGFDHQYQPPAGRTKAKFTLRPSDTAMAMAG